MTFEELLKLLDKKDFGIALTGGVTGFVIDAIFFATTGLPPGTVAGLSAGGAVGIKYLFNNVFKKKTLRRRAFNFSMLLEKEQNLILLDELNNIRAVWDRKIINDDEFETRLNEVIKKYL